MFKYFILLSCMLSLQYAQTFNVQESVQQVMSRNLENVLNPFQGQIMRDAIGWKNDYPRYDASFKPISNKFHPELSNYRPGILMMNFLFYYTFSVMVTLFVLFLVCRLACKRCGGKDQFTQKKGNWGFFLTNFLLVIGAIFVTIGCILVAFGTVEFSQAIDRGISNLTTQKNNLQNQYSNLLAAVFAANGIRHEDYQLANNKSFIIQLRNQNLLQAEISQITKSAQTLIEDADNKEYGRNVWTWLQFTATTAVLILFLAAWFAQKPRVWFGIAVFCFFLACVIFLLISYNISVYFVMVDMCEEFYRIVYQYQFPIKGERLGYYISCFSPVGNEQLLQDIYLMNVQYRQSLTYANLRARDLNYAGAPFTNSQQIRAFLAKIQGTTSDTTNYSYLNKWATTMNLLQGAVQSQNKIRICEPMVAFSMAGMKKMCIDGFDAMPQVFTGMIMWALGFLCFVVGGIRKEIEVKKLNKEILKEATKADQPESTSDFGNSLTDQDPSEGSQIQNTDTKMKKRREVDLDEREETYKDYEYD